MTEHHPQPRQRPAMTEAIVRWAMRQRGLVLAITATLVVVTAILGHRLRFDALPDVTTNQVLVLTRAPGLTPEEIERLVSRRIESALGGMPGLTEQRSISRYGISSVTAIFEDSVDPWLARQIVQERLQSLAGDLPEGVDAPELGPLTGGLGEIYHFAVSSPQRTPAELLELVQLQIAPLLRSVPGVVEVNWWGGSQRSLDVVGRPADMARHRLTLADLQTAVGRAVGSVPGASVPAGGAQVLLRGVAWPRQPAELAAAVVKAPGPTEPGQAAVRVGDVADVVEGMLPRLGTATARGGGETIYVMVQMLRDANALEVMQAIHGQMPAVRELMPRDVRLDTIYDRSDLVQRTLMTVAKNLAEGGALVVLVLLALLGSLRAGLLVALVIPLSMLGATMGMIAMGIPGNLMSLGALDFGLLVDGAVVMVEGLFHALRPEDPEDEAVPLQERLVAAASGLARPVFFAVLVIVLVYVPVLSLQGVDGKMFRPMAATVIFALVTALLLSLTFVPAAASLVLRPQDVPTRDPLLVRWSDHLYAPVLAWSVKHPGGVLAGALAMLALGGVLLVQAGSAFVPQLDEGDLVVQATRAPDISLESAAVDAGRLERLLADVPEVQQVVSRIGSPAVATDIMGYEQADVFVQLKPRDRWRPGLDRERLIAELEARTLQGDPSSAASFTQPIQMRFNELLGGAVTDVAVSVYGEDLVALRAAADKIAAAVSKVHGAEDVHVLAPPAVSMLEVVPRHLAAAQHGWSARDVLDVVAAVRTGLEVATTYDGPVRVPVRVRLGGSAGNAFRLEDLQLPSPAGTLVPLRDVADVVARETPSLVMRQDGQRRLVVGFNVRGAELGDVVGAAQAAVARALPRKDGMRLEWGGQFETLQEARRRLSIVIPVVLLSIVGVLAWTFRRLQPAALILLNVPFAAVGGVAALAIAGMPISLSAAIGFIALSGIAVLNGVVLMAYLLRLREGGMTAGQAAVRAARSRLRPVLMTALVAMLGFLPMMLATGPGSEVQRPLATVVVGGLVTSTLLTLVVLPTLVAWLGRHERAQTPGVV